MRDNNSGKIFAICSLNSDEEEMLLTRLPLRDVDRVTANPSWSKKSRPIRDLRPSATTVNVAESKVHPLLVGDCIFSSTWIGSFEKSPKLWEHLFADSESARSALYHLRREWAIENAACASGVHEQCSSDITDFDGHVEGLNFLYSIFDYRNLIILLAAVIWFIEFSWLKEVHWIFRMWFFFHSV